MASDFLNQPVVAGDFIVYACGAELRIAVVRRVMKPKYARADGQSEDEYQQAMSIAVAYPAVRWIDGDTRWIRKDGTIPYPQRKYMKIPIASAMLLTPTVAREILFEAHRTCINP